MSTHPLSVVCCEEALPRHSRIVAAEIDSETIESLLLETAEQELAPGTAKELHNAVHHPDHGPVTYLQQVNTGGFSVFTGDPAALQETFFGPGSLIAFMDDEGPGHASKVGPDGVQRTFRILKGHLPI